MPNSKDPPVVAPTTPTVSTLAALREAHKVVGQMGAYMSLPAQTRCACGQMFTPEAYSAHLDALYESVTIPIAAFRDQVSDYLPAVRLAAAKALGIGQANLTAEVCGKVINAYVAAVLTAFGKTS